MNWTRRLRWRVMVPVLAALAALAAAALPAAAQAAGPPGPGAGPKVPAFGGVIAGRSAGPAAPRQAAPVLPLAGDTPAVAWNGGSFIFDYTGSDKHAYAALPTSPAGEISLGGTLTGGPGLAFVPAGSLGSPGWIAFARGGGNALYVSEGGTSWLSLGGSLTSRPGVAAGALHVSGGEAIDVVVRGPDGAVWDLEANATSGRPWHSLGGRTLNKRHTVREGLCS